MFLNLLNNQVTLQLQWDNIWGQRRLKVFFYFKYERTFARTNNKIHLSALKMRWMWNCYVSSSADPAKAAGGGGTFKAHWGQTEFQPWYKRSKWSTLLAKSDFLKSLMNHIFSLYDLLLFQFLQFFLLVCVSMSQLFFTIFLCHVSRVLSQLLSSQMHFFCI